MRKIKRKNSDNNLTTKRIEEFNTSDRKKTEDESSKRKPVSL